MKNFVSLPSVSAANKPIQVAFLCFVVTVATIILYRFDPAIPGGIYPPSPFRELTGLYCPGCGTLRSLHQLLHGNFLAAFDLNPLMILALPYLIYSFLAYSMPVIMSRRLPTVLIKCEWIWLILKIILGYWILRNIPIPPFAWLAP